MKSETINFNGEDIEVIYEITEGMKSNHRDQPDDEDKLQILEILLDGFDISAELTDEDFDEIEKLLTDKILN
jgi:hypothetical protein